MTGYILLEGGAEFGGEMAEPDRRAISLAGGVDAKIRVIPTAAAPDNNHQRAGGNAERWFKSLGATDVTSLPLIDGDSAADDAISAELRTARLIYMLGGFTHHLGQTLKGSKAWQACLEAYEAGAVIAGSSAGAMVLCEYYVNPSQQSIEAGLNLVPNGCVLPHHDTFGKNWATGLKRKLPQATLIGIDERTGMLNNGEQGQWTVYGQGAITLYHGEAVQVYPSGASFSLPDAA